MKVCVLASGSEGNSTYIECSSHKILIDLGMNLRYIKTKLEEINIALSDIDSIFISHTHSDHVGALDNFLKKNNPTVYMSKIMYDEMPETSLIKTYNNIKFFDDDFFLDDIKIELIKTSHDTNDSRGFIVTEKDKSVVYITDTGYLNQRFFNKLRNKNVYLFESNHDVEMLINGKYPKWLKDRVVGPYGHLSNKDSSIYLAKIIGDDTKKIILMHLSKENNTHECALNTIHEIFDEYNVNFDNIDTAKQREISEVIEL